MFLIAICHPSGDKWQSKTLILMIFDLSLSIILMFSIVAYLVCLNCCVKWNFINVAENDTCNYKHYFFILTFIQTVSTLIRLHSTKRGLIRLHTVWCSRHFKNTTAGDKADNFKCKWSFSVAIGRDRMFNSTQLVVNFRDNDGANNTKTQITEK